MWTCLWILCAASSCWAQQRGPAGASFKDRTFDFYHEFYGPRAYTNPEVAANIQAGMANGVSLQPPLDAGLIDFVTSRQVNLMVDPSAQAKNDLTPASFTTQQQAVEAVANMNGVGSLLWNLMPEWDQSGGSWVPGGRPKYTNLSKEQAYLKFLAYYRGAYPVLTAILSQPPTGRKHWQTAITDHGVNAFYAYEMGADMCLLERSIDELGDISTGIAFLRGAARQYDRRWGIDVSTFRTSNNMATRFDDREVLLGGWSPSYLKRHYYLAYMAGAHALRNEATSYYKPTGQLDPLGRMTSEFANFALERHRDVGRPVVPTALLLDHFSGFDPKHWIYNQSNYVWYQDIPFTDGDRMIDNYFQLAFPDHWLHGQTPGASFNDAAGKADPRSFQRYLAGGGDPRPFEPMGKTRYGHSQDVITDRASLEALRNYRVIVMLGNVPVDARLRQALSTWVEEGGTLVTTVSQRGSLTDAFLGVQVGNAIREATAASWRPDSTSQREPSFQYFLVRMSTATALAIGVNGDPLVTVNSVGKGRVIFSAVPYLLTTARDQFLNVGVRLFDWLAGQNSIATVVGAPIEYLVNRSTSHILVTLVNNSGDTWEGTLVAPANGDVSGVTEYVTDQNISWIRSRTKVVVPAQVAPYDVKVYAIEFLSR